MSTEVTDGTPPPKVNGQTERVVEQLDDESPILSLFSAERLDKTLRELAYSAEVETKVLVEIANNTNVPSKVRLKAVEQLRDNAKQALELAGRFKQVSQTREMQHEGQRVIQHVTSRAMVGLARETSEMLEQAGRVPRALPLPGAETTTPTEPETENGDEQAQSKPAAGPAEPAEPQRDLGGGGLCASSQARAIRARERVSERNERSAGALGGGDGAERSPAIRKDDPRGGSGSGEVRSGDRSGGDKETAGDVIPGNRTDDAGGRRIWPDPGIPADQPVRRSWVIASDPAAGRDVTAVNVVRADGRADPGCADFGLEEPPGLPEIRDVEHEPVPTFELPPELEEFGAGVR